MLERYITWYQTNGYKWIVGSLIVGAIIAVVIYYLTGE